MNCTMNTSLTQRGMLATRMQRRVRVNANRVLGSSAVCKKVADETEQTTVKSEKNVKTKAYNQMVLRSAAIPVVANLAYNPTIEALASKPGTSFLQPIADNLSGLGLPDALIHWGHPGNMAVVLFAMGGYGAYLGWQIRSPSDPSDAESFAKAKDLHPKLMAGMTFFFTAGATGGAISMAMQGQPVFESSHFITGVSGLVLLYLNGMLTLFFEDDPNARGVHAFFGSGILALFVAHMAVGVKLGLSI
mmetsp:Transcript_46202/g.77002  ORF Transcript_46202/g.77002 Transcript_46202/m.77002 type:complete len:247 (+) Transcript_46202:86-826(+)